MEIFQFLKKANQEIFLAIRHKNANFSPEVEAFSHGFGSLLVHLFHLVKYFVKKAYLKNFNKKNNNFCVILEFCLLKALLIVIMM